MSTAWPINIVARRVAPSNPNESFTSGGVTYRKTGSWGLVPREGTYAIVPLFKKLLSSSYFYDTGTTLFPSRGKYLYNEPAMAIYSGYFSVMTSTELSGWLRVNVRTSKYLVSYYASIQKGSALLQTNAQINAAMQQIKDALTNESKDSVLNTETYLKVNLKTSLAAAGFSQTQINSFINGTTFNQTYTPPPSNTDTGSQTPGGTTGEQKIVVRAPFGYIKPPTTPETGRPQLLQVYPLTGNLNPVNSPSETTSAQIYGTEQFIFPYIPNNISYQGSGSEWVEIPRSGDFPIVEWSRWQLLKISMEFLIANQRVENQQTGQTVPDGIFLSVHEQIETLRRMAQRPYPVSVLHLDHFFKVALRRAQTTGKPMEFVISDFSWTATRRTMNNDGIQDSEITAATCRMTLQEVPIETTKLFKFDIPILAPKAQPKQQTEVDKPTDGRDPISTQPYFPYSSTPSSITSTSIAGRSIISIVPSQTNSYIIS